jgi:hypothetical protein
MNNKLIYWIPVVGVLLSLVYYKKENDMGGFWPYYQTVFTMASIWLITYLSLAK